MTELSINNAGKSATDGGNQPGFGCAMLTITNDIAQKLSDGNFPKGSTLLSVTQNPARALYEICYLYAKISPSDFEPSTIFSPVLYGCPSYTDGVGRNEMREIADKDLGSIMEFFGKGNTLGPNKRLICQRQDTSGNNPPPQLYPSLDFLTYISEHRKRFESFFVFMSSGIGSTIHGTPHFQVQPNYANNIQTLEENISPEQRFNAGEIVSITKQLNKNNTLFTILALTDGSFAIMKPDYFLGMGDDITLSINYNKGYTITIDDNKRDTEMLYARMARDLSTNQGLSVGGVELRTENVVFHKETIYYRFYKWIKRGISIDQIYGFLNKLLPEMSDDQKKTLFHKVKLFTNNMESVCVMSDNTITLLINTLSLEEVPYNIDDRIYLNQKNNPLQKRLFLAFLMTKGLITINENNTINYHTPLEDLPLLSSKHIRMIYNKCRGPLVTREEYDGF